MKRALGGLVAVLLTVLVAGCSKDHSSPGPDDSRLPDVTLAGFDGSPDVDLGTFKGPAVVNLWAWWCARCKAELPLYADFARDYAGKVAVLGIDFQETNENAAKALLKNSGVGYPLAEDPDGKLRALGLPKLILVDADGKIAYQEYVEIKSTGQLQELVAKHLGVSR